MHTLKRQPPALWAAALLFSVTFLLTVSRRASLLQNMESRPTPASSRDSVPKDREASAEAEEVQNAADAAAAAIATESNDNAKIDCRFKRAPAFFVRHLLTGTPSKVPGMAFKEFMYQCFLADAKELKDGPMHLTHHARPPLHPVGFFNPAPCSVGDDASSGKMGFQGPSRKRQLRAMSFNVHFFREGYSDVALSESTEDVLAVVKKVNPDLLFIQEVNRSKMDSCKAFPKLQYMCYPLVSL